MLVSNIRHFLTETGSVPDDLPKPAERILRRLSRVVAEVTSGVSPVDFSGDMLSVRCVRRPGGRACPGLLLAGYSSDADNSIWWECTDCGDPA